MRHSSGLGAKAPVAGRGSQEPRASSTSKAGRDMPGARAPVAARSSPGELLRRAGTGAAMSTIEGASTRMASSGRGRVVALALLACLAPANAFLLVGSAHRVEHAPHIHRPARVLLPSAGNTAQRGGGVASAAAFPRGVHVPAARLNRRSISSPRASGADAADGAGTKGGVGLVFPIFVVSAIVNRIIYKIQLVPMRDYTYFLSQFSCCCYVIVYGIILLSRIRSGIVTQPMLSYARDNVKVFAVIGTLEALTFLLALYSAARIPGGLIGVLGQGALIWTVIMSRIWLGTRYDTWQKCGVALVLAGVLCCTYPQAVASGVLSAAATAQVFQNSAIYSAAMALTAAAVILKQKALQEANLDVIVVSALGSMAQFVATLALLPVTLSLATSLPPAQYLQQGLAAFMGASSPLMPWLACMYMVANITLNLSAIALVKRGGAVATMVAGTLLVPVYGLVFCFNLPLLGAAPFSWDFVSGLVIVTVGSFMYNHQKLGTLVADYVTKVWQGRGGKG
eukprot:Tamp_05933.p1 GENE.Tamp_05933~~Tamp_05933.p1  ORF type:complete len:568 (-),score=67.94 Tamp_05933:1136-2665(-)